MPQMKRLARLLVLPVALAAVSSAWSGHELPIYPSYYPQEIRIETVDQDQAADLLLASRIQAYLGAAPAFTLGLPDSIGTVESLGSFVVVRLNPGSASAKDEASACALSKALLRGMRRRGAGFVFHPYPVTPFHGDYLDYADLAEAAKTRLSEGADEASADAAALTVKAEGALAQSLLRPEWQRPGADWDAAVEEVSAADLVSSAALASNAWLGPPWLRAGWFQAALLMQDAIDDPKARELIEADLDRLKVGTYGDAVERINLERELTTLLTGGCRRWVAGYTMKREYFSAEYSAGIENVGFDAIEGLNSPIFIRTAKLKDFPWNGELSLGTTAKPVSAWNPIAGFNDGFGRLLWSALSDPALIPSPNDGAWMLNRTADVQPGR
jgi:hypothetical protein